MNAPDTEPPPQDPPERPTPVEDVFLFCPNCGTANDTKGKVPFRCGSCHYANFFGPVAAVGGLIVNDNNELLLVRRARDPGKGQWGLPGGFVDRGESVEQSLAREIQEETSLIMTTCEFIYSGPNLYNYRGVVAPVLDMFFECGVEDREQIKLEPTELDHYEWLRPTPQHIANMAFESNKKAVQHWLDFN